MGQTNLRVLAPRKPKPIERQIELLYTGPNAKYEWSLRRTKRRHLLCIYVCISHIQWEIHRDIAARGKEHGGLQHAGISTCYWHLINIAECFCFLALNAVRLCLSTLFLARLTTLSANVKCSCSCLLRARFAMSLACGRNFCSGA